MRDKIYQVLNRAYAIIMTISFWGGALPLIPFVIAIIVGGTTGEAIALYLYNKYYPWIIAMASIAVVIGLVAMYVGKQEALSSKTFSKKKDN